MIFNNYRPASRIEQLAVQIMQPLNATGTLEQALAQSFAEATAMYKGTSMSPYSNERRYRDHMPAGNISGVRVAYK